MTRRCPAAFARGRGRNYQRPISAFSALDHAICGQTVRPNTSKVQQAHRKRQEYYIAQCPDQGLCSVRTAFLNTPNPLPPLSVRDPCVRGAAAQSCLKEPVCGVGLGRVGRQSTSSRTQTSYHACWSLLRGLELRRCGARAHDRWVHRSSDHAEVTARPLLKGGADHLAFVMKCMWPSFVRCPPLPVSYSGELTSPTRAWMHPASLPDAQPACLEYQLFSVLD